jgi:nucleotide-binding universal stress UspA family protein
MNVIVVGVDHSPGAKAALVFAEEEARLRGATLRAVHAWQYGYIGYTGLEGAMPVLGGEMSELHAAAEAALERSVREALPDSDVEIEQRAVQGVAAGVLVDESRDADLLVVGSRGHGGFTQLLLGSVSQQCAHHAECPVVIVRAKREEEAEHVRAVR